MKSRNLLQTIRLAQKVKTLPDGTKVIERFNLTERFEHQVLIISFTLLAITGLVQRYSDTEAAIFVINEVLGGIDSTRVVHHISAIVMAIQTAFHFGRLIVDVVVNRNIGNMLPSLQDLKDLIAMFKYFFNKGEKPKEDRFTIDEKIEYWALLYGTIIIGITGLIQWFPVFFTKYFPGIVIPISRTIHSWEAVLAVSAIVTWHMYHTLIKERNFSIFTGWMPKKEVEHNHPLEYERIQKAYQLVEQMKALQASEEQAEEKE